MRVEKITKRQKSQDRTTYFIVMAIGLFAWALIGTFLSTTFGFVIFAGLGLYAYTYLVKNELGENRKQINAKRKKYYSEIQTYAFSRNYKE